MKIYETAATVEAQGQVRVAGVPFAAGTRVEVTITPVQNGTKTASAVGADPAAELLSALDKARNSESVGPLRRTELYDRDVLR